MSRPTVDVFVSATGNAFMRDIASWLVEAAGELGYPATLRTDGAAPNDASGINLVVAPHEFYLLGGFTDAEIAAATALSVPVCTEQPGTKWFELTEIVARPSPLVLDINNHGVAALKRVGIDAAHLRLGGTPSMAAPAVGERTTDVLFLGGATDRRSRSIAALAPQLWNRRANIKTFSFSRPVDDDVPGLVFGDDKYRLLAESRILLNVHRDDRSPGYFEWARIVEALANGCCVLTEPVEGFEPLRPGEHFIVTDDLDGALADLLADPATVERIGQQGRRAVLEEYPLRDSLAPILKLAERRLTTAAVPSGPPPRFNRHLHLAERHPLMGPFVPFRRLKDELFREMIDEVRLVRRIDRARCLINHGQADHIEITTTPGYDRFGQRLDDTNRSTGTAVDAGTEGAPRASVVITLYNYGHLLGDTLESVLASTSDDDTAFPLEVVIVDDHSTDDSRAAATALMARHPEAAIILVGADYNSGLPGARNLGFAHSRAPYVMVMDADNLVYPTAIDRLATALDDHSDAAFAYSTMVDFGADTGLRSAMDWYVPRLCENNYIDAQAMFRKRIWQAAGGYSTADELVFGWEDWEMWLRFASLGMRGVHVPEMLGCYRVQKESMLSTTNLVADSIHRWLMSTYRSLPWPHPLPPDQDYGNDQD